MCQGAGLLLTGLRAGGGAESQSAAGVEAFRLLVAARHRKAEHAMDVDVDLETMESGSGSCRLNYLYACIGRDCRVLL